MARRAAEVAHLPLLKLKLGAPGDDARLRAVRRARPDARLVADANEGVAPGNLAQLLDVAAEVGLECLEQPLPAGRDRALADVPRTVPICADESFHTAADIAGLRGLYDAVNVKLDKAGGLTAAVEAVQAARAAGLKVMVGCMVATSLAMVPALALAPYAEWIDLAGPLLLAADRPGGLVFRDGVIQPPEPGFWGGAA
jgi:L-alanine-DL-glutamate epimerase-like enolase superfamily enzyme